MYISYPKFNSKALFCFVLLGFFLSTKSMNFKKEIRNSSLEIFKVTDEAMEWLGKKGYFGLSNPKNIKFFKKNINSLPIKVVTNRLMKNLEIKEKTIARIKREAEERKKTLNSLINLTRIR